MKLKAMNYVQFERKLKQTCLMKQCFIRRCPHSYCRVRVVHDYVDTPKEGIYTFRAALRISNLFAILKFLCGQFVLLNSDSD